MRVAIIAALPREVAQLVHGWKRDEELARRKIFVWSKDAAVVACAGMGSSRAALAFGAALAQGQIGEVVSAGWAGGLHAGIAKGGLFEPRTIIDVRTGERFIAKGGEGVLVTCSSVAGPAEKRRLRESYGADLVDMEAATVARLAQALDLPFRAVKVVSDAHDFDMPELARFSGEDGWFREGAFAMHVISRPHLWVPVIRMANVSKQSAAALCERLRGQLADARAKAEFMWRA